MKKNKNRRVTDNAIESAGFEDKRSSEHREGHSDGYELAPLKITANITFRFETSKYPIIRPSQLISESIRFWIGKAIHLRFKGNSRNKKIHGTRDDEEASSH